MTTCAKILQATQIAESKIKTFIARSLQLLSNIQHTYIFPPLSVAIFRAFQYLQGRAVA
jgi:hypothetical protein